MNSGRAQRLWWRENLSVRESCKNSQNFSFVDFNSVLAAPHAQVTRLLRSIPGLEVSEPQLQEVCDSIDVKAMRMSPGEPVDRSLRRLYKHFCRHPLRRRWPSADDIQHLPPDSELVSIPQELLTDPDAWQAILQRFEGYPAQRCAKQSLPVDDSILLNACGFTCSTGPPIHCSIVFLWMVWPIERLMTSTVGASVDVGFIPLFLTRRCPMLTDWYQC